MSRNKDSLDNQEGYHPDEFDDGGTECCDIEFRERLAVALSVLQCCATSVTPEVVAEANRVILAFLKGDQS